MIAKEQRPDVEAYLVSRVGFDPSVLLAVVLDFLELSDGDQQAVLKVFAAEQVAALTDQLVRLDGTKAVIEAKLVEWGQKDK